MTTQARPLHLRLPATSANLGPGFDALGLAMALYLTIDAHVSDSFDIAATGRNADLCGSVKNNLILTTYTSILSTLNHPVPTLKLKLHNEIPLGMGCGSSAAALIAGVLLANHFGNLNWTTQQILDEAAHREGHPDNVAACFLGGMTASAMQENHVVTATCGLNLDWNLFIALPPSSLATEKARALLPPTYPRADAVQNVQNTALLVSAFALNRPELLRTAMQDHLHQPYRMEACPLLRKLLPLSKNPAISGLALSGAGPSVLLIAENNSTLNIPTLIHQTASDSSIEILQTTISGPAIHRIE